MKEGNKSRTDDTSYVFNASYSDSIHSQSFNSVINNREIKIQRSSSYVYDLDDSLEYLGNTGFLSSSLQISSMPDLRYLYSKDFATRDEPPCHRHMSAAPDYFHGSFRTRPDSCVDLSSFIKDQNEIFDSHCNMQKNIQSNGHSISLDQESTTEPQVINTSTVMYAASKNKETLSTPFATRNTVASFQPLSNVSSAFCQSDPCDIEMEVLVLPMVNDFSKTELRMPTSSLSAGRKKVLKRIASENELIFFYVGKGKSKYLVLRKTASLLQKQAAENEAQLRAKLEMQRRLEQVAKQAEESQNSPQSSLCVVSTQTELKKVDKEGDRTMNWFHFQNNSDKRRSEIAMSSNTIEAPFMNAAARRKARRAAERLKTQKAQEALMKRKDAAMQTCPPNWLLCPWCTKDIPPTEQCGHIAMCRAIHRHKNQESKAKKLLENFRRKKQNISSTNFEDDHDLNSQHNRERQRSRSASKRNSSRSRTRSVDANFAAALKRQTLIEAQLKEIHPNDVNGMLHATQRVCAIPNCTHIISPASGGHCAYCRFSYCPQHRAPYTGHSCASAPKSEKNDASEEVDAIADRQIILKQRMRERINAMAERRRR